MEKPKGFKSDFDFRACELLAREYERFGQVDDAECIRLGMPVDHASLLALRAISEAMKYMESERGNDK